MGLLGKNVGSTSVLETIMKLIVPFVLDLSF